MGRAKARVLPVPVWAVAIMSRPSNAGGIACACTGVGSIQPFLARLILSAGHKSGICVKLFIVNFWCQTARIKTEDKTGRGEQRHHQDSMFRRRERHSSVVISQISVGRRPET